VVLSKEVKIEEEFFSFCWWLFVNISICSWISSWTFTTDTYQAKSTPKGKPLCWYPQM